MTNIGTTLSRAMRQPMSLPDHVGSRLTISTPIAIVYTSTKGAVEQPVRQRHLHELRVERQHHRHRPGRRRHADEETGLPRRFVGRVQRHIKARQPERRADHVDQHRHPAEPAEVCKCPHVDEDRRRHSEVDEVGDGN